MARMFDCAGQGPALVIGADIPAITPAHIADCFALLGRHDAVIGPAPDGGYWAIGLRHPARRPRAMFSDVRWSGPHARADTLANLRGLRVGMAATLSDVDEAADL